MWADYKSARAGKEMIMQKSKNAQSQYMLNTNNVLFGL